MDGIDKDAFRWEEASIKQGVWDSLEEARAERAALEARRAERRRIREERKAAEAETEKSEKAEAKGKEQTLAHRGG